MAQLIANGIFDGSLYALLAVGFSVAFTATLFYDMSIAVAYVGGPYGLLFLMSVGVPPVPAVGISVVAVALIGAGTHAAIYRPMLRRGVPGLSLMLVSLAVYIVAENILGIATSDERTPIMLLGPIRQLRLGGVTFTVTQLVLVAVALASAGASAYLVRATRLGESLRAVCDDPELAEASGVDVSSLRLVAATWAWAAASISGICMAMVVDMRATMGLTALLVAIVSSLIVGPRRVMWVGFVAVAMGVLRHVAIWRVSSGWQEAVLFAVLLFYLVARSAPRDHYERSASA